MSVLFHVHVVVGCRIGHRVVGRTLLTRGLATAEVALEVVLGEGWLLLVGPLLLGADPRLEVVELAEHGRLLVVLNTNYY